MDFNPNNPPDTLGNNNPNMTGSNPHLGQFTSTGTYYGSESTYDPNNKSGVYGDGENKFTKIAKRAMCGVYSSIAILIGGPLLGISFVLILCLL
jgi:hypothetical protein